MLTAAAAGGLQPPLHQPVPHVRGRVQLLHDAQRVVRGRLVLLLGSGRKRVNL
jgi:hypothetical protein